ncbi:MAG TPA: ABC transporter permease [Acidimicrobiia bacterium]|nr:ABC transporter permease [Acidimicrobiia bacterium]
MKAFAIARVNLIRLMRDRLGLFFIILLPFIIVLVMGAAFGGSFNPKLGVIEGSGGSLGVDLLDTLESSSVDLVAFADEAALIDGVARNRVDAGLVVPADYSDAVETGESVSLRYYAPPNTLGGTLKESVGAAIAVQSATVRAARFAASEGIGELESNLAMVESMRETVPGVRVETVTAGESVFPAGFDPIDHSAQGMLVLFMFLTSLTAADKLILSRTLGVSRRMLSTPTGAGTVLIGEGLGRFAIAFLQGLLILLGTAFGFNIDWGNVWLAIVVVTVFALVGTGIAMLAGSVFRTAEQAGSFGVLAGLMLAAVGGAMVPFEIFPTTMQTISKATPHYWALRGFKDLIYREGSFGSISLELAVLAGFAVCLIAVAVYRFRRILTD